MTAPGSLGACSVHELVEDRTPAAVAIMIAPGSVGVCFVHELVEDRTLAMHLWHGYTQLVAMAFAFELPR